MWERDAGLVPQGLIQILLKSVEMLPVFHGFGLCLQIATFFQAGILLQMSLEYTWEIWQLIKYSALSQYSQWSPWMYCISFEHTVFLLGKATICILVQSQTCSSFLVSWRQPKPENVAFSVKHWGCRHPQGFSACPLPTALPGFALLSTSPALILCFLRYQHPLLWTPVLAEPRTVGAQGIWKASSHQSESSQGCAGS